MHRAIKKLQMFFVTGIDRSLRGNEPALLAVPPGAEKENQSSPGNNFRNIVHSLPAYA